MWKEEFVTWCPDLFDPKQMEKDVAMITNNQDVQNTQENGKSSS